MLSDQIFMMCRLKVSKLLELITNGNSFECLVSLKMNSVYKTLSIYMLFFCQQ